MLDMRGDWACSAVSALRLGASYVLATHLSDGELSCQDERRTAGNNLQVDGYWKSVMSSAVSVAGSSGRIEMQSAGIGEMLAAGWTPPTSHPAQQEFKGDHSDELCSGFDIIVTELVDCMGVLIQGTLDDLQLAIQLSGANERRTKDEQTDRSSRAVPRRILTVPQRAVVYAQLISSVRVFGSTRPASVIYTS